MKFKKILLLFLFVVTISSLSFATQLNAGFGLGAIWTEDDVMKEEYDAGFLLNGHLGVETDYGLELQAKIGISSIDTINPSFMGRGDHLTVVPLNANLIYNFIPSYPVSPYFGAGVGAYFWNIADDQFDSLEKGVVFGFNLLGGVKFKVNDKFYINAQYEKNFLPAIFFPDAQNFDSSAFTIGAGFVLYSDKNKPTQQSNTYTKPTNTTTQPQRVEYKYTREQESLLVEIQQLENEIKEMKLDKRQSETEIDEFYEYDYYDLDDDDFQRSYARVKYLEKKVNKLEKQILEAQNRLDVLKSKWNRIGQTKETVEQNIVYLQNNYSYSPYGVRYVNGYFLYNDPAYRYRYYNYESNNYYYYDDRGSNNSGGNNNNNNNNNSDYYQKKAEHIQNRKNRTLNNSEQNNNTQENSSVERNDKDKYEYIQDRKNRR